MKKKYEVPAAEVVKFEYRDQVVAASGCVFEWRLNGDNCSDTQIRPATGCQQK